MFGYPGLIGGTRAAPVVRVNEPIRYSWRLENSEGRKSLTQDNDTLDTESEDQSGTDEESPVIKKLRQELRDTKKELASQPKRSDLEAAIRAQVRRESSIERELESLGHPRGIRSVIEEQLGDAEPTRESVAEALVAIGYEVTADESDGGEAVEHGDLKQVSALSSQVQSAAQQKGTDDFYDRLNKTSTPEDIARLMAEQSGS